MDSEVVVRAYYDAIDAHDYETFAGLFAPDVVHYRPDRTIEGRDTLVSFMRDDRPNKETSHELSHIAENGGTTVAEGRLLDADGDVMFAFEDDFSITDGQITEIRTRTR
ncbi:MULTISPECIES: nuclear transport factor 2 family protein [unclassified Haladaptatus]|uniref:nuclear transport factor 2 family protein n=1 Tax=unclassified Haladaptatus TaxID=2622732 RepID=UPI00209C193D|nr:MULTISPECIES: nuclear transport factor 2 family protein [unclassified Haladaptatus]MCO8243236.1 nuclear transport factor 2 family protein [Haladaptatus sp. AB643]MCO8252948.1 nuclear transport factor 2 family protein [Haladaptatus sp. AB618]